MTKFAVATKKKAKTFIIHRGSTNQKLKGHFEEVEDGVEGKKWLVGEEVTGTYQERGEVIETTRKVRVEITGLTYSVRG